MLYISRWYGKSESNLRLSSKLVEFVLSGIYFHDPKFLKQKLGAQEKKTTYIVSL